MRDPDRTHGGIHIHCIAAIGKVDRHIRKHVDIRVECALNGLVEGKYSAINLISATI
jgi:hypothetical protein